MAKFLSGSEINVAIERIIKEANSTLIIMSPYIKVHHRFTKLLNLKREYHELEIRILFGKNGDSLSKSFFEEDYNFFTEFPNIEIRHEEYLHAKYFANEKESLLTSMNFYDYSSDNNIEFGVLTSTSSLIGLKGDAVDKDAYEYFGGVFSNGKTIFRKEPRYKERFMGLKREYTHSDVIVDKGLFGKRPTFSFNSLRNIESSENLSYNNQGIKANGYCIRTGAPIPFDIMRPLCTEAYRTWSQFSDPDYPEKYFHYSGEPSNGETSYAFPILKKNWNQAKKDYNF